MELHNILAEAVKQEASDILLKVGVPPCFRIRSDLLPLEGTPPLDSITAQRFADELLDEMRKSRFASDLQVDFAYDDVDLGRFRINLFRHTDLVRLQATEPFFAIREIPCFQHFTDGFRHCL